MLLGFISLLLTVFQSRIVEICVPPHVVTHLLPCALPLEHTSFSPPTPTPTLTPPPPHKEPQVNNQAVHYHAGPHHQRHLLEEETMSAEGYCRHKVLKSLLLTSSYILCVGDVLLYLFLVSLQVTSLAESSNFGCTFFLLCLTIWLQTLVFTSYIILSVVFTEQGSVTISWGVASPSCFYICPSYCACDILCFDYCIWRSKGESY